MPGHPETRVWPAGETSGQAVAPWAKDGCRCLAGQQAERPANHPGQGALPAELALANATRCPEWRVPMHVTSSVRVTAVQEAAALGDPHPPGVPSVPTAGPEVFLCVTVPLGGPVGRPAADRSLHRTCTRGSCFRAQWSRKTVPQDAECWPSHPRLTAGPYSNCPQPRMAGPCPEPAENVAPPHLGGTGLRPARLVTLARFVLEAVKTGVPLGSVPITEANPVDAWQKRGISSSARVARVGASPNTPVCKPSVSKWQRRPRGSAMGPRTPLALPQMEAATALGVTQRGARRCPVAAYLPGPLQHRGGLG